MSEPTYGSGQYDPQQGYGGQPSYGNQPYGGQPAAQQQPYPTGQQPQQPYGGGYGQPGQQPGGYQSGSYAASPPSTPKAPQDKVAQAATFLTYIGYACAVFGVLGFILYLAADNFSTAGKIAAALLALATGLGLGGLNYAAGVYLGQKKPV